MFVGAKNLGNLPLMGLKTEGVNSIISSQFFIFVFVFVCFSLPSSRIQNRAEKKREIFFLKKLKNEDDCAFFTVLQSADPPSSMTWDFAFFLPSFPLLMVHSL